MNLRTFGTLTATALLAGCSSLPIARQENAPPDQLSDTPLLIDGAMQMREWDRSTSYYANGDTEANPTLFAFRSTPTPNPLVNAATETPLFVAQVVALPINALITPPWAPVTYTGVTTPPTFNAMPPLPPTSVQMQQSSEPVTPNEPPATQPTGNTQ